MQELEFVVKFISFIVSTLVVVACVVWLTKVTNLKTFELKTKDESFDYIEWYVEHNLSKNAKIVDWDCRRCPRTGAYDWIVQVRL